MKKALLITSVAMIGLSGCSKAQTPEVVESPSANAQEVQAPQAEAPAVQDAKKANAEECKHPDAIIDEKAWSDASNGFSLNLLRATSSKLSNTVVSAYSVERAFGMVLEGACGETAKQMQTSLSMPEAGNLGEMGSNIEKSLLGSLADPATIQIDNKLWLEKTYTLLDSYTARMQSAYHAEINQVDFVKAPEESRKTINDSVAKSTMDKIQNILPAGSITATTRLVLTNAIYFKAPWIDKFEPGVTKKEDFKTANGPVQVDMMFHTKKHNVFFGEGYKAIAMSFSNSSYYLAIILPDLAEGQDVNEALMKVENSLTAASLRKMNDEMEQYMVRYKVPKFRVEFGTSLRSLLQSMGMVLPFSDKADFSGMTSLNDLLISDVFHKAYIDIDENGAEAAAATAIVMRTKSMARPPMEKPLEITVDHPFTFALMDKKTGTALFIGRVVNF